MTFKKGDLVMVVRPSLCCNNSESIGRIHTVGDQSLIKPLSECDGCGQISSSAGEILLSFGSTVEKSRLIKIDPPADQDQETKDKELEVFV